MRSVDIVNCGVCGQEKVKDTSAFCSGPCEQGSQATRELSDILLNHQQTDDARIFFFDHSFGELIDLYTTALIKRVRQKSLREQNKTDALLGRLEKSILTKFNRWNIDQQIRAMINGLVEGLYNQNSYLWRLRLLATDETRATEDKAKAALEYIEQLGKRENLVNTLNSLVDIRED